MRKWLRILTIGTVANLAVLPAYAETLADALTSAYRNSNLLAQNQAVLRAADEDAAIAMAALRPVVSYAARAGASYSHTNGHTAAGAQIVSLSSFSKGATASFDLSASLVLFDYGRRDLGLAVARENVMATRQSLIGVEQDVLLAAVQAYVDVRLRQEIVLLRQSNYRLIERELQAARDRFEVGEITRTDVSIAEAALAGSRAGLVAAEGDLRVARETYKAVVGVYPGNLAPLPKGPMIAKSLEDARAVARSSHPAVLQAQHNVKIADLNVELAKAATQPIVSLSGGATLSGAAAEGRLRDSNTLGANVGLSMNQTLYAGGEYAARYRKALAQKEASLSGLRQTVVAVEQNAATLWSLLAVYAASIAASEQQIEAARSAFEGVREEAALGARTTLDVLDAEQDWQDARMAKLEVEAQRYVGVYQVLAAMGLMNAKHLQLGIPTYDPAAYYNAVKDAPLTSVQGRALDRIFKKKPATQP